MTKTFCDCCERQIGSAEKRFSLEITSSGCKEIYIPDMCVDCYKSIEKLIVNAKFFRKNNA